jgi:hypothetical protein
MCYMNLNNNLHSKPIIAGRGNLHPIQLGEKILLPFNLGSRAWMLKKGEYEGQRVPVSLPTSPYPSIFTYPALNG